MPASFAGHRLILMQLNKDVSGEWILAARCPPWIPSSDLAISSHAKSSSASRSVVSLRQTFPDEGSKIISNVDLRGSTKSAKIRRTGQQTPQLHINLPIPHPFIPIIKPNCVGDTGAKTFSIPFRSAPLSLPEADVGCKHLRSRNSAKQAGSVHCRQYRRLYQR